MRNDGLWVALELLAALALPAYVIYRLVIG